MNVFDACDDLSDVRDVEILPDKVIIDIIYKEGFIKNHAIQIGVLNKLSYFRNIDLYNSHYASVAENTKQVLRDFGLLTGRYYNLYDYYGHASPAEL